MKEKHLIYQGRNKVWLTKLNSRKVVVKEFHKLGFFKGFIYTFFRKNKAQKAFDNAMELLKRGVLTPEPIDVKEVRRCGLLCKVYYISSYTDWQAIRKPLTEDIPYNRQMAIDFAHFVARLHEKGIIHHDLNNTNVLYKKSGQHYNFMLIDINRMSFTSKMHPAHDKDCLENLCLFSNRGEMFDTFANVYVRTRGWDHSRLADALKAKDRHDRRWKRKKKLKRLLHL